MVADMAANMEVHMVADKKRYFLFLADMLLHIVIGDRQGGRHGGRHGGRQQQKKFLADMETWTWWPAGHECWLIGPKLVRPKPYPACASFKLCKFFFENETLMHETNFTLGPISGTLEPIHYITSH